jgi:hypothetical protein
MLIKDIKKEMMKYIILGFILISSLIFAFSYFGAHNTYVVNPWEKVDVVYDEFEYLNTVTEIKHYYNMRTIKVSYYGEKINEGLKTATIKEEQLTSIQSRIYQRDGLIDILQGKHR